MKMTLHYDGDRKQEILVSSMQSALDVLHDDLTRAEKYRLKSFTLEGTLDDLTQHGHYRPKDAAR
jgi:hypothetical protein